ncbi:LecA/PA-IL family lectin [Paludibaculum fermentans]|uniref:LecA/PA-IL family lectin n=1 Tax=Paludibaculum fermentans TaxID=1473598 RepID=UPI003EBF057C
MTEKSTELTWLGIWFKNRAKIIGGVIVIVAVGVTAIMNWPGSKSIGGVPAVEASYAGSGDHKKPVVVVFIHGIFGDKSTWGRQESSFPEMLVSDPALSGKVDAFSFRYYTPAFQSAANVSQLAVQLDGVLEDKEVMQDHEKVVFLCHSMGGLVLRRHLLMTHKLDKVAMIYFYATPTNGVEIANIAKVVSSNPQLRAMFPLEGNELLQNLQDDWLHWEEARRLPSYCAYEAVPTVGNIFIVPQSSARALCSEVYPMNANHMQIVKPPRRDDPRYSRFVTAMRKAVGASLLNPATTISDQPYPRTVAVEVPGAREQGTYTEVFVKKGDVLRFSARGIWCWGGTSGCSDADGTPGRPKADEDPEAVMLKGQHFGTLIGRVKDWYFAIGTSRAIEAKETGNLVLLMNDRKGTYDFDNSGSIQVTATVEAGMSGRRE